MILQKMIYHPSFWEAVGSIMALGGIVVWVAGMILIMTHKGTVTFDG